MRAAVYLRQSLDRDGDGLAVARQRKDCLRLCAERGWDPVEYLDNNLSASSGKVRPAYEQMLADIEAGHVQAVITWDLDRLHRRPVELEHFIEIADRHRIALATVGGDTDLGTDGGRLFARIKGAVARGEMERKSARQVAAARQRAELGRPWCSRRPFGYQIGGLELNTAEVEVLRQAYQEFLLGKPLTTIAAEWNRRGVTTTTGRPWAQPAVHSLLRNPRNAGLRAHRGKGDTESTVVGPASWPCVVDEPTWRAVTAKLSDPARRSGGGGGATYLLSGIATCGVCGATVRKGQRHRDKVAFYRCSAAAHLSRTCAHVDDAVTRLVLARLAQPDAALLLVDDTRPDVAVLRSEAEQLRQRLDTLAAAFADGAITGSQLRTGTGRMRARLEAIEHAMSRADRRPVLADLIGAEDLEEVWDGLPLHRRRAVMDLLMTITLMPARKGPRFDPASIDVTWNT